MSVEDERRAAAAPQSAPWSLLDTYLKVECVVVESTRNVGLVSLRPALVHPHEGGLYTTLQARLTEAGFKPGDQVMIVPFKPSRRKKQKG